MPLLASGARDRQQQDRSRYRAHLQQPSTPSGASALDHQAAAREIQTPPTDAYLQSATACTVLSRFTRQDAYRGLRLFEAGLPGAADALHRPRRIPDRDRYPPIHHPGALRCITHGRFHYGLRRIERYPDLPRLVRGAQRPGIWRDKWTEHQRGTTPATHHQPDRDKAHGPRLSTQRAPDRERLPARASGERLKLRRPRRAPDEPAWPARVTTAGKAITKTSAAARAQPTGLSQVGVPVIRCWVVRFPQRRQGLLLELTVDDRFIADHQQSHRRYI